MWFVGMTYVCGYLGVALIFENCANVNICPGSAPVMITLLGTPEFGLLLA